MSAVSNLYYIKFRIMSNLFLICLTDGADKCIYRIIFYNAYRAAAESASGNAGAS